MAILASGCGSEDTAAKEQPPALGFAAHACEVEVPPGQAPEEMTCGTLTVPEDWSNPEGPRYQLEVAVLHARSAEPAADPLLFLGGGPGAPVLDGYLQSHAEEILAPIQETRDIVFFDQRGVGRSRPSLDCPEWQDMFVERLALNQSAEADEAMVLEAMQECHERLAGEGVNFSAFSSAAIMRDAEALMLALGYENWNLYGISYGTRLAQVALRDTPEHVRSVILDSVVPTDVAPVEHPLNIAASLATLAEACAADPDCDQRNGDIEEKFYKAVTTLDSDPIIVKQENGEDLVISGNRLVTGSESALRSVSLIQMLPDAIRLIDDGVGEIVIQGIARDVADPGTIHWGMNYSVFCAESAQFISDALIEEVQSALRPELVQTLAPGIGRELCSGWGTDPLGQIEIQPVTSDTPALVLSGQYDPITPSRYGQRVADSLSNSQHFVFRGVGHGVLRAPTTEEARPRCAQQLVTGFLDDPAATLDGSCVDALPDPEFGL